MRRLLTLLLLGGCVALSACLSKPKKKAAELPFKPPTRQGRGPSEAPKATAEGTQPKAPASAPAPAASRPKPPVEPPPVAARPAAPAVPPPAQEPKTKEGANAAAPAKVPAKPVEPPPVPQPTVQRGAPDSAALKAPQPPGNPPTSVPKPEPTTVSNPVIPPPPPQPLPATTRVTKPVEGRALEINLAPKPVPTAPAGAPLRTAVPAPAASQARPAAVGPILGVAGMEARPRTGEARSLPLPPGGGGRTNGVTPAPPLALQFGQSTNQPPATNATQRAIGVDPLLQGAAWREQQQAKQAAEQKAREEEQQKLKAALYRFLLKGGTNR